MIKLLKLPFIKTEGYFGQELLIKGVLKINEEMFIFVELENKSHFYKLIKNEALDPMSLSYINFDEKELNIIMDTING